MPAENYYEILGVGEDAGDAEIKRAFRKLAKECHPDRTKGDARKAERFKKVNEAYKVLSDKEKRAQYDQVRKYGFDPSMFGGQAGGFSGFEGLGDLGSILAGMFGGAQGGFDGRERRARPRAERGADVHLTLAVPLEVILKGGEVKLTYTREAACQPCAGTGSQTGKAPETCRACQGSGREFAAQGGFGLGGPCSMCYGRGVVIAAPCAVCRGRGLTGQKAQIALEVPRGAADGETLRVAGKGHDGRLGGSAGDLRVTLKSAADDRFARQGADLAAKVPVDLATAVLGGVKSIELPTGAVVELRIPPGTQPGTRLRLRDQGLPKRGGGFGALLVEVDVRIPKTLTDAQRKAMELFSDPS